MKNKVLLWIMYILLGPILICIYLSFIMPLLALLFFWHKFKGSPYLEMEGARYDLLGNSGGPIADCTSTRESDAHSRVQTFFPDVDIARRIRLARGVLSRPDAFLEDIYGKDALVIYLAMRSDSASHISIEKTELFLGDGEIGARENIYSLKIDCRVHGGCGDQKRQTFSLRVDVPKTGLMAYTPDFWIVKHPRMSERSNRPFSLAREYPVFVAVIRLRKAGRPYRDLYGRKITNPQMKGLKTHRVTLWRSIL